MLPWPVASHSRDTCKTSARRTRLSSRGWAPSKTGLKKSGFPVVANDTSRADRSRSDSLCLTRSGRDSLTTRYIIRVVNFYKGRFKSVDIADYAPHNLQPMNTLSQPEAPTTPPPSAVRPGLETIGQVPPHTIVRALAVTGRAPRRLWELAEVFPSALEARSARQGQVLPSELFALAAFFLRRALRATTAQAIARLRARSRRAARSEHHRSGTGISEAASGQSDTRSPSTVKAARNP